MALEYIYIYLCKHTHIVSVLSYHFILDFVLICYDISYLIQWYYVTLCRVLLCCTILYHIVSYLTATSHASSGSGIAPEATPALANVCGPTLLPVWGHLEGRGSGFLLVLYGMMILMFILWISTLLWSLWNDYSYSLSSSCYGSVSGLWVSWSVSVSAVMSFFCDRGLLV